MLKKTLIGTAMAAICLPAGLAFAQTPAELDAQELEAALARERAEQQREQAMLEAREREARSAAMAAEQAALAEEQAALAREYVAQAQVEAESQEALRAQYLELTQARAQLEESRRQMEQAARAIAAQPWVLRAQEVNGDMVNGLRVLSAQGAQPRIGATIVNADDGALVTAVTPGQGADEAGIKVGDVIRSIDGVDVTTDDERPTAAVIARLREVEPGEAVSLVVERNGDTMSFDVETAARNRSLSVFAAPDGNGTFSLNNPEIVRGQVTLDRLGDIDVDLSNLNNRLRMIAPFGFANSPWGDMELIAITEGLGRYFETDEGLLVVASPDDDAIDIEDGDVILAINGRTPNSPEHAIRILSSFESGETIEFSLMRDGRRRTVEYEVPEAPQGGGFGRFFSPEPAQLQPPAPEPLPVPTPD